MTKQATMKLATILALIAGVLALSASAIDFLVGGKMAAAPLGGGLFMLVLAFGSYKSWKSDSVE